MVVGPFKQILLPGPIHRSCTVPVYQIQARVKVSVEQHVLIRMTADIAPAPSIGIQHNSLCIGISNDKTRTN